MHIYGSAYSKNTNKQKATPQKTKLILKLTTKDVYSLSIYSKRFTYLNLTKK